MTISELKSQEILGLKKQVTKVGIVNEDTKNKNLGNFL